MSGNPFRASLIQNHPAAAPPTSFTHADSSNRYEEARDEREGDSVLDVSTALPIKTKKSVRIESPTETIPPHPASYDADDILPLRTDRSGHAGSPPPTPQPDVPDNIQDISSVGPTRREADERDMIGNTWKSTGVPGPVHSFSNAPANPFSRTLTTIEPQEKDREPGGQSKERTATDMPVARTTRQSLNVEGFKNLLMHGIASPRSSGPPPQMAPAPHLHSPAVFESSSSTDTSSVSRQSIFDPAQEPHPESPRTSYDMPASDDERISLMGDVRKEKKKPPPTPKHRHGKLVSPRAPQTVSFSEFFATENTPSPPVPRKTSTDLNKPLPPTPSTMSLPLHIISQDSTQEPTSTLDTKDGEAASISDAAPSQRKAPPPVPLARRQSQLRSSTGGNRSRSNSSLTMSSQHSIEAPSISLAQEPTSCPSSQKAAPPPPPSRRHGAPLSTIKTSSAQSSTTDLSSSETPRQPKVSSSNAPSSRRTTFSSEPSPVPGVTRTSSLHSARNPRSVSNESTNMPPPPPPPRRRQPGRSSLDRERPSLPSSSPTDPRRTSAEDKRTSIDGRRPASVASVSSSKNEHTPVASHNEQALYSPRDEIGEPSTSKLEEVQRSGGSNSSNILDDMEKFQKEIDELRDKYKQAA